MIQIAYDDSYFKYNDIFEDYDLENEDGLFRENYKITTQIDKKSNLATVSKLELLSKKVQKK